MPPDALGFWAAQWATISVLWQRDLVRFFRQPSRLIGALGQPIIFWAIIGGGMEATFVLPGSATGYRTYFFPGVMVMVTLFAAIFASVSVIEDRHQGFLQAVMCGPGTRLSLVLGKCFGSASVGLSQVALFLLLAPQAGLPFAEMRLGVLLAALLALAVSLSALGFAVAWYLDNVQAYHAVQMTLLVPLWVLSGAMFPPSARAPALAACMAYNPLSHGVALVRWALHGGAPPPGTEPVAGVLVSLVGLSLFAAACLALAAWVARPRALARPVPDGAPA